MKTRKLHLDGTLFLSPLDTKLSSLQVVADTKVLVSSTITGAKDAVSNTVTGVVDMAKGAVHNSIEKTRNVVVEGVNTVMTSKVGQMVTTGVDNALNKSEEMVDHYLPLTEEELGKKLGLYKLPPVWWAGRLDTVTIIVVSLYPEPSESMFSDLVKDFLCAMHHRPSWIWWTL